MQLCLSFEILRGFYILMSVSKEVFDQSPCLDRLVVWEEREFPKKYFIGLS